MFLISLGTILYLTRCTFLFRFIFRYLIFYANINRLSCKNSFFSSLLMIYKNASSNGLLVNALEISTYTIVLHANNHSFTSLLFSFTHFFFNCSDCDFQYNRSDESGNSQFVFHFRGNTFNVSQVIKTFSSLYFIDVLY